MANICANNIIISGEHSKLLRLEKRMKKNPEKCIFTTLIKGHKCPVPYECIPFDYLTCYYGPGSGKARYRSSPSIMYLDIDSRWSPLIDEFIEVAISNPDFHISLKYHEPGCQIIGWMEAEATSIAHEEYVPYLRGLYIQDNEEFFYTMEATAEDCESFSEFMDRVKEDWPDVLDYCSSMKQDLTEIWEQASRYGEKNDSNELL